MSETEAPFCADRAPTNRASCKKCKQKIEKDSLRLAKLASNPFGDGTMKLWHHVACLFDAFKKQRATTARICGPDDIGGWDELVDEDKEEILKHLPEDVAAKARARVPPATNAQTSNESKGRAKDSAASKDESPSKELANALKDHKDNSFREFRRLCVDMSNESSYTGKTALVKTLFDKGSDGSGFKGDVALWCRLLLPGAVKRVYNLQSRQLCKLLARVLLADADAMLADLENGDVAETARETFDTDASRATPARNSRLTLGEVDEFLARLAQMTKEDDQAEHFQRILPLCTANDLKILVRLIKHDLRINAGPKHVLAAVHPDAYAAFQTSRDMNAVLERCLAADGLAPAPAAELRLMTPAQPMLASPCRASQEALAKCPGGLLAEIKYDGERVQVHKRGTEFRYFSRSLKPVLPHKVAHFSQWLPTAFPAAADLVLDAEVLLVDTRSGLPLPFGSLGKHKQAAFEHANVCLFVFDCLLINDESLLHRPLSERRSILADNLTEVPHRVVLSEQHEVASVEQLDALITRVLRQGLEGLVLKDAGGGYEPGARRWLKVKRDYLLGGSMADSVDLLVLGAWFGTGAKGGMMSSFLMGVRSADGWRTVTKVHGGFDDAALAALQTALAMRRIGRDPKRCPDWLVASRSMVPDLVAEDPATMPVWEVTGAEFTQHEVHTADGISIRFPRVTQIRMDKDHRTATTLDELRAIFAASRNTANFTLTPGTPDKQKISTDSLTPHKRPLDESTPGNEKKEESPQKKIINEVTPTNTPQKQETPKKAEISPRKKTTEKKIPIKKLKKVKSPSKKVKDEAATKDSATTKRCGPTRPLPTFLSGVAVVLPAAAAPLRRHLAAAGGTALAAAAAHRSSHVLHAGTATDASVGWPRDAAHVRLAWLRDSLKLQARQPERTYAVFRQSDADAN